MGGGSSEENAEAEGGDAGRSTGHPSDAPAPMSMAARFMAGGGVKLDPDPVTVSPLSYVQRGANRVRSAFDPSITPTSILILSLLGLLFGILIGGLNIYEVPRAQSRYERSTPPASRISLPPAPFAQVPPYDGDFIREQGLPV